MTATPSEARNQVFELINDAFTASGLVDPDNIVWQVEQKGSKWDGSAPYLHVSMFNLNGVQATLANALGEKRYRRAGNVIIQAHAPLDFEGDLLGLVEQINYTAEMSMFNKVTSGGVEFDSVIATEIGRNGPWYVSTITAVFEYDEIT